MRAAVVGLLLWQAATPALAWDHPLAYFNEAAAPWDDAILLDSDLDWGQDLFTLQAELRARGIDELHLAWFGSANPCRHAMPTMRWLQPGQPVTGWVAISQMVRHEVVGAEARSPDGPCEAWGLTWYRDMGGAYSWLDAYTPVAEVGRSVLLYDIPEPTGD